MSKLVKLSLEAKPLNLGYKVELVAIKEENQQGEKFIRRSNWSLTVSRENLSKISKLA